MTDVVAEDYTRIDANDSDKHSMGSSGSGSFITDAESASKVHVGIQNQDGVQLQDEPFEPEDKKWYEYEWNPVSIILEPFRRWRLEKLQERLNALPKVNRQK